MGIGSNIVKNIFRTSHFCILGLSVALVTDPKLFVLFFSSFDVLELISLNEKCFVSCRNLAVIKSMEAGRDLGQASAKGLIIYNSPE